MNKVVLQWLGKVTSERDFVEPVVEFGVIQVAGQEGMADMRRFFPGKEYIGCDLEHGAGVDRVENVEFSHFAPNSAGTVLCLETLEHVRCPWRAAEEMFPEEEHTVVPRRDGLPEARPLAQKIIFNSREPVGLAKKHRRLDRRTIEGGLEMLLCKW